MIKFTAACAQFAITPMQPRENMQKAVVSTNKRESRVSRDAIR
jgi:hypothetical protein